MMVEPGRLALTTTPSIFPSSDEETVPVSAAEPWFCAIAGWAPAIGKASSPMLAIAPKDNLVRTSPSRVTVVIEPSRGGAVEDFILIQGPCRQEPEYCAGQHRSSD